MGEKLLSVGLDVGTTSTQMVVSRLTVENKASAFSVPEMEIQQRELLYQSPVYFTPLLEGNRMDAPALRRLAEAGHEEICEVFDGEKVVEKTVSELAREALG